MGSDFLLTRCLTTSQLASQMDQHYEGFLPMQHLYAATSSYFCTSSSRNTASSKQFNQISLHGHKARKEKNNSIPRTMMIHFQHTSKGKKEDISNQCKEEFEKRMHFLTSISDLNLLKPEKKFQHPGKCLITAPTEYWDEMGQTSCGRCLPKLFQSMLNQSIPVSTAKLQTPVLWCSFFSYNTKF